MNFENLNQRHKVSLPILAKKYNISLSSANRLAKQFGKTKSREQYEQDAQIRRETAYKLRQDGLKWREVAEKLNITEANARVLAHRYKQSLNSL